MTDAEGAGGISRAAFLGGATGVAGAVALGLAPQAAARDGRARASQGQGAPQGAPRQMNRFPVRHYFAFGPTPIELVSVEGGDAVGTVVQTHERKGLGAVHYEPIKLNVKLGSAGPLLDWAAKTWDEGPVRRSGAVVSVDYDDSVRTRLDFSDAILTDMRLPRLDTALKDELIVSLTVVPARTHRSWGSGERLQISRQRQRLSSVNLFRLSIDGLDARRVTKIEGLGFKFVESASQDPSPGRRQTPLSSDLSIVLAQGAALDFAKWFDEFVVAGNNGSAAERSGKLELLGPDLKTVHATIGFEGLGIFRLKPLLDESEKTLRHAADMYCQRMRILR